MNVIDLLKKDHELVSDLFKQYEKEKEGSDSDQKKQTLANQICQELTVHATVEEELFYPVVEARAGQETDEEAEDGVHEADEEHALVKILVAEIQEMSPSDKQYDAKVKVLKDLVEHHVEEEEGQLMPRSRKLIEKEELEALGDQVEARKEELKQGLESGRKPERARPRAASKTRTQESIARPIARRAAPAARTSRSPAKSGRSTAARNPRAKAAQPKTSRAKASSSKGTRAKGRSSRRG
jgi:hemerythrin superfamily protein